MYFILRSRLAFAEVFQREQGLKGRILEVVANTPLDAKGELKRFLPVNQHGLLKNFQSTLQMEMERAFPSSR